MIATEEARAVAIDAKVRRRAFRDPPHRTLSQWADDEVTLAPSEGGGAGKWSTDFMPFLREIMDVIGDAETEEVVVKKSAQVGFTIALVLAVIYFMVEEPTTILAVEPTEDMVKKLSTKRLMPNIQSTPAARGLILENAGGGARHSGNTITQKDFPGGYLVIAWASSPSQLRSLPARVVFKDETDAYETTSEGDPTALAERAATTFGSRRKIVDGSTPTIKGFSRVEKRFDLSDQRYFHIPCPACKDEQVMRFANVTYDNTSPETAAATAKYACEHCGVLWDSVTRDAAVKRGRWIATYPERPRAGFHLTALLSPYVTLGQLAREFEEAKHDPDKLMVFVNLKLGETFEDRIGEAAGEHWANRETFDASVVPMAVGMLTCMVDVQGDRLEALVMGHGGPLGDQLFPIEHRVIVGDPAEPRAWHDLDAFRKQKWPHASGHPMGIRSMLVDVGYLEGEVLKFTKPREGGRVYGVRGKGRKRPLAPMLSRRPSRNNALAARVWDVNTDKSKDLLFRRLRIQQPGAGYIHKPTWFDDEATAQLVASERKVPKKMPGGEIRLTYKKVRDRNEMLDLFGGNIIAGQPNISGLSGSQVGRLSAKLALRAVPLETEAATDRVETVIDEPPEMRKPITARRKGNWANRWRNG